MLTGSEQITRSHPIVLQGCRRRLAIVTKMYRD
jgi:hypothetical protein